VKSADPASLQGLNDIVLPESAGWWPLASGWYFLLGLLLVFLTWFIYTSIKHRIKNRYRRTALNQLQLMTQEINKTGAMPCLDLVTLEEYLSALGEMNITYQVI